MTFDKGDLPTRDGQIVEVVLRGPAHHIDEGSLFIGEKYFSRLIVPYVEEVVSVKVLPDPPPPWRAGDVVRLLDGETLMLLEASDNWARSRGTGTRPTWWIDDAMEHGAAFVLIRGGVLLPGPAGVLS